MDATRDAEPDADPSVRPSVTPPPAAVASGTQQPPISVSDVRPPPAVVEPPGITDAEKVRRMRNEYIRLNRKQTLPDTGWGALRVFFLPVVLFLFVSPTIIAFGKFVAGGK